MDEFARCHIDLLPKIAAAYRRSWISPEEQARLIADDFTNVAAAAARFRAPIAALLDPTGTDPALLEPCDCDSPAAEPTR
jgi:hypothetical protein